MTITPGPWKVYEIEMELSDLGREKGMHPRLTRTTIGTDWEHPQLEGPVPIIKELSGPYQIPNHYVYINPDDARLIAAAPDLLEAAKALLPFIDDAGAGGETDFEDAVVKLKAAIEKASVTE